MNARRRNERHRGNVQLEIVSALLARAEHAAALDSGINIS
eukprot:SAG31_NODE_179_length_21090_cov_11.862871_13_plen_40_part_00